MIDKVTKIILAVAILIMAIGQWYFNSVTQESRQRVYERLNAIEENLTTIDCYYESEDTRA